MTSTRSEIDESYSVSNEFFALWLDRNMHYTSAAWDDPEWDLETAQEHKARVLYDFAELDENSRVLDIGCGWGSALECFTRFGIREAVGITLSTEQARYAQARNHPKIHVEVCDYAAYEPDGTFDGLVSIEMIDHLSSPAQHQAGESVGIYRRYFNRLSSWVEPGACFGFQAILRNRIPRKLEDILDLKHTVDTIFPGALSPRIEELVKAISPSWELEKLIMRRTSYRKTTAEWLRRLEANEALVRDRWGDELYDDYHRYLRTSVRGFDNHWLGDVQMKLRRLEPG